MNPVDLNVKGVSDLVRSGLNKTSGNGGIDGEGIQTELIDILSIDLDNEELLRLASTTASRYAPYEAKIRPRQNANKQYYLGQQNANASTPNYPLASNLIFEAEETFLPAALSKNPEPVVWSDDSEEGAAQAKDVKTMLQYHADILALRRKLNRMTRQWSVNFLGVVKHGWETQIDKETGQDKGDIMLETRDAQNFIFDPEATIDEHGDYKGGLLGEQFTCPASRLIELFPKEKAFITVMVDGFMGTKCTYTEWHSDDFVFYTFKNRVLDKHKNPTFAYSKPTMELDQDGAVVMSRSKPKNHFSKPKMPYTFLSVFSFGRHPHDETGLIEQNIPQQNSITKRTNQIDVNLDRSNNSIGLSGANFNEETGKQAQAALEAGRPVLIPAGGPVSDAIARFPAPSYPDAAFKQLETSKNDLRTIFGTQGITSQQPDEDQTARGMILNSQMDTSRIGGGIGDALEQVARNIFNWWYQLYCVYYDDSHFAAILGQMKAVEYSTISNRNLERIIVISVAPNSMKPKDEVTEMNQALALWQEGAMDPKTLFTILDFPDAQKTAEQVTLWKLDPQLYMQLNFPELFQQMQQKAMAQQQAAAAAGVVSPEQANGEPAPSLSTEPANPALNQVPLGA